MARLRGLLAIAVMVLMFGASSQAAVCDLMCGLHVEDGCQLAASSDAAQMDGSHAHCAHGIGRIQQAGDDAVACGDSDCNHASIPDFVKGGSTTAQFSAMQWVVVDVVPVGLKVLGGSGGVVDRPPLLLGGVDPLSVSLRV